MRDRGHDCQAGRRIVRCDDFAERLFQPHTGGLVERPERDQVADHHGRSVRIAIRVKRHFDGRRLSGRDVQRLTALLHDKFRYAVT